MSVSRIRRLAISRLKTALRKHFGMARRLQISPSCKVKGFCVTQTATSLQTRDRKFPTGNTFSYGRNHGPPCTIVTATITGGFSCNGSRGNVYKILEQEHGCFSLAEGRMVTFTGNDLSVKAYFRTWDRVCSFQTRLKN